MSWLTKAADVLLGVHRLAGLLRLVAAALLGVLVAPPLESELEPHDPLPVIGSSESFSNSQAQQMLCNGRSLE